MGADRRHFQHAVDGFLAFDIGEVRRLRVRQIENLAAQGEGQVEAGAFLFDVVHSRTLVTDESHSTSVKKAGALEDVTVMRM